MQILDEIRHFVHGQSKLPEEIQSKYREIGAIVDESHRHSIKLNDI